MNYFLRTYIEVKNDVFAHNEANKMVNTLNQYGNSTLFIVQRYWKINEYYEVSIDIQSDLTITELSQELSNNWDTCGSSYIWTDKKNFFVNSQYVRWASLEIIE